MCPRTAHSKGASGHRGSSSRRSRLLLPLPLRATRTCLVTIAWQRKCAALDSGAPCAGPLRGMKMLCSHPQNSGPAGQGPLLCHLPRLLDTVDWLHNNGLLSAPSSAHIHFVWCAAPRGTSTPTQWTWKTPGGICGSHNPPPTGRCDGGDSSVVRRPLFKNGRARRVSLLVGPTAMNLARLPPMQSWSVYPLLCTSEAWWCCKYELSDRSRLVRKSHCGMGILTAGGALGLAIASSTPKKFSSIGQRRPYMTKCA